MSIGDAWRRWTDRLYRRVQRVVMPGLVNSHYIYAQRLKAAVESAAARQPLNGDGGGARWLDMGCGHDFLPPFMPPEVRTLGTGGVTVVGIDMDEGALRRHTGLNSRGVADVERLPFADGSFDLVTANMVVEHVADPAAMMRSIARVLRPGGRALIHTPNARGYTTVIARLLPGGLVKRLSAWLLGRRAEDVYPTFYRANTVEELRALARGAGLAVERLDLVQSSPLTIAAPPLMLAEVLWIRVLERPAMGRWRACVVAEFTKEPPCETA